MSTTNNELKIENQLEALGNLLDAEYGVTGEFYGVIRDAVNKHAELIGKQEATSEEPECHNCGLAEHLKSNGSGDYRCENCGWQEGEDR